MGKANYASCCPAQNQRSCCLLALYAAEPLYAAEAWLGQPLDELVRSNAVDHGRLGPPAERRDPRAALPLPGRPLLYARHAVLARRRRPGGRRESAEGVVVGA